MDSNLKTALLYGGGALLALLALIKIRAVVDAGKAAVGAVDKAVDRVISDPLANFAAGYVERQPGVTVNGRIFIFPSGPTILVNDIVAEGSAIRYRTDGAYEFKYRGATYVLDSQSASDGTRVARKSVSSTTPK